jgi:hypothetical protein
MKTYEIPDPFVEFVHNKNLKLSGAIHDYFAKEWSYKCSTCLEILYAPSKKTITKTRLYHTRNICLGGY